MLTAPTNSEDMIAGQSVYILHPYRGKDRPGERKANLDQIATIAIFLARNEMHPISPIHCSGFLNDENPEQRELGMRISHRYIALADMVWAYVCGPDLDLETADLSDGCRRDLEVARRLGKRIIPLAYVDPLAPPQRPPICETPAQSV